MSDKVRENRLRHAAERRGLRLHKSRRRDPGALNYGVYWLHGDGGPAGVAPCGAGPRRYAEKLHAIGHEVAALDRNPERVDAMAAIATRSAVGDGTDVNTLRRIGAEDADAAVISTGDDITASAMNRSPIWKRNTGNGDGTPQSILELIRGAKTAPR